MNIGAVQEISHKYNVTVPQLYLRYDLQLGTVVLPKTANPDHMKSNAAVDFTISDADMETLKNVHYDDYGAAGKFPVFGGKYELRMALKNKKEERLWVLLKLFFLFDPTIGGWLQNQVACPRQNVQGLRKVFLLNQDIIRIVGGYGENANVIFGQNSGQFGQNAHQGKIQDSLDAESLPAIIPGFRCCRYIFSQTDQGQFLVRFPHKIKITGQRQLLGRSHLADRQVVGQGF